MRIQPKVRSDLRPTGVVYPRWQVPVVLERRDHVSTQHKCCVGGSQVIQNQNRRLGRVPYLRAAYGPPPPTSAAFPPATLTL